MIVTIEGVDQAGKGTQSRMLVEGLRGEGVGAKLFGFPDYDTPSGMGIREFLDRGSGDLWAVHGLLAENRREKLPEINKAIRAGLVVVMNRYRESNLVYGMVNGFEREWLAGLDSGMPESDVVILLDIPADESFRRKSERDAFESDRSRMEKVVDAYRKEAKSAGWLVVDGRREPDVVHGEIMDAVRAVLRGKARPKTTRAQSADFISHAVTSGLPQTRPKKAGARPSRTTPA